MGTRSRRWRLLLPALAAVALLPVATPSAGAGPAALGCAPKANEIRFRAADGTRLAGYRFGRGRTAVVLAHQLRGSSCQWIWYARRLAAQGYLAIAFDFRGDGDSQARSGRAGNRRAADVAAAARVARAREATKVFLVGASMGGTVAVGAAAVVRPAVAGVVAVSSPSAWVGIDALALARRLQVPVLYVAAENDSGFADELRALYEATASTDKAIEILPGGDHGVVLVRTSARARQLLEGFVRAH
jgi:alpha-beta hydrolase superfamily lysophospholipase